MAVCAVDSSIPLGESQPPLMLIIASVTNAIAKPAVTMDVGRDRDGRSF